MRCNTAPFAPDSRSASGNVAATNGKVSRAFRRERERRSSTTGSGSRRNAPRTASCWDRGALLLRRRTQTLRPGHGRNPNDLGRLSFASGARSRARSAMRTRSPVQSWSGTRGSVYRPSPSDRVDVVGGVQQAPRRTETRAAAAAMGPTRGEFEHSLVGTIVAVAAAVHTRALGIAGLATTRRCRTGSHLLGRGRSNIGAPAPASSIGSPAASTPSSRKSRSVALR